MTSLELPFNYCPQCGNQSLKLDRPKKIHCQNCHFTYYQNNAASVAVLILTPLGLLLTKRAKNPGKGLFDLPGGFVDPGECAEQAAKRELFEELKLKIETKKLKYMGSQPNRYPYQSTLYHTCDLFFQVEIQTTDFEIEKSEIESISFIHSDDYNPEKIAFDSIRKILNQYFIQK